MLEVFRVPFSKAVPWYGPSAMALEQLKPFDHHHHHHHHPIISTDDNNNSSDSTTDADTDDAFLLGCVKYNKDDDTNTRQQRQECSSCVLYLHGFPDQSVDHRKELPELYGKFSTRMTKKLSDAFDCFAAINFSGSPGSSSSSSNNNNKENDDTTTAGMMNFRDKTVSQEIWDVMNTMSYLCNVKQIGTTGFHIIGLSTGAIIGSVLRGLSSDIRRALSIPPILSISIIASCGCSTDNNMETALSYDFDKQQLSDFDALGHCTKQFWLPIGSISNPRDAVLPATNNDHQEEQQQEQQQSADTKWCPHQLELGVQYKTDFLQLPIKEHLSSSARRSSSTTTNSMIPLLVIHGGMDKNIPIEEGRAVFATAAEPKKFLELPKGNHLLTNSKDLKKAISEIKKWNQQWEDH